MFESFVKAPTIMLTIALVPFMVGLAAAGAIDVFHRKVPNVLVALLIPLGVLISVLQGGSQGLAQALLGCLVGGALLLVPFAIGATGGGDVKLLATLGTVTGPVLVVKAFLLILAIGVVVSIVNILYRRALRSTWLNLQLIYYRLMSLQKLLREAPEPSAGRGFLRDNTLPFGAIIALGGEVVLVLNWWGKVL